tara:strand:- start:731 stop:970 length:240 start_codon:yes stop_codon:yes gene_type:complete
VNKMEYFDLEPNEGLMIGDDIPVYVLKIRGSRAKIGIDAPRHIRVYRPPCKNTNEMDEGTYSQEGNTLLSLIDKAGSSK